MVEYREEPEGAQLNLPPLEINFDFEFERSGQAGQDGSITRRPDAFAFSHHFAFTFGPVALGDVSQGLLSHVWRVRFDTENNRVYLCRAASDNTQWLPEILLFEFNGAPIIEMDLSFEQNARPVVCASRLTGTNGASEIWVHWYDPNVGNYVFENEGPGRTPRSLLDQPLNVGASDVLIFYIEETLNRIVYRQQRDRYEIVHNTPFVGVNDVYIEDVVLLPYRLQIYISRRNRITGRYTLETLTSTLFPITAEPEEWEGGAFRIIGGLTQLAIVDADAGAEEWEGGGLRLIDGSMTEPLIYGEAVEEWEGGGLRIQAGSMAVSIIFADAPPEEWSGGGLRIQSGSMAQIVVDVVTTPEEWQGGGLNIIAGSMFVP